MAADKLYAVKVYLSADEYLAFNRLCEAQGLPHSAWLRMKLKEGIRAWAAEEAKDDDSLSRSNIFGRPVAVSE